MRHLFVAAAATIASFAAPAVAQTAEEQRQLEWVVERGRTLFALDRAAWVATDDMLERVPREQHQDLRGYIVDRDEQGYFVIFFAEEGGRPVTLYRGRISTGGVASRAVFARGQRPALTPAQQRMARVRAQIAAAVQSLAMCSSSSPNLAIVPPSTPDGPMDAYVMTPQTDNNVIPFGGHHRLTLDKDGRILARRAFTNACADLPLSEQGRPRPAALAITHLLDPLPTEIHVFTMLAARLPIYVSTQGAARNWAVESSGIRLVDQGALRPRR